jgi:hypothetical protein
MANYVYNTVSVYGNREELVRFAHQLAQPYSVSLTNNDEVRQDPFMFWNVIQPTPTELPYYTGELKEEKPEGYDSWDLPTKMAHDLMYSGKDWYDWNIRNWGTKWEGFDHDSTEHLLDENPYLYYSFTTAWSPPENVYRLLGEQYPSLRFEMRCEEEQGWGFEYEIKNGEFAITKEWDIPDSHADWVAIDNEDGCICSWSGEPEEFYTDCPDYKAPDPNAEPKVCEHKFVPVSVATESGIERASYDECVFCNDRQELDTTITK